MSSAVAVPDRTPSGNKRAAHRCVVAPYLLPITA